jgi:hypothetical protein
MGRASIQSACSNPGPIGLRGSQSPFESPAKLPPEASRSSSGTLETGSGDPSFHVGLRRVGDDVRRLVRGGVDELVAANRVLDGHATVPGQHQWPRQPSNSYLYFFRSIFLNCAIRGSKALSL